jgi:hypothetical protein
MLSLHGSLQPDPFAPEHYIARQSTIQPAEVAHTEDNTDMGDARIASDSDEELAAPRGSKRKVVDIIPATQEAQTEVAQTKKKKKGVRGEASVAVVEATTEVVEQGKKKRKKKKAEVAA